eukprot:11181379-Lingulodinium_polyedra.AAC.1
MGARPMTNSSARTLMTSSAAHGREMSLRAARAVADDGNQVTSPRAVLGAGIHDAGGLHLTAGG